MTVKIPFYKQVSFWAGTAYIISLFVKYYAPGLIPPDVEEMLHTYGAPAIALYLIGKKEHKAVNV